GQRRHLADALARVLHGLRGAVRFQRRRRVGREPLPVPPPELMIVARLVTNFALFQAGWFACVLGAAWGQPWTGAALALAAAAWHVARAARPGGELALVLIAAAFGAAFDSMLAASGWLVYASPAPWAGLAPVWIVALWACFATTL